MRKVSFLVVIALLAVMSSNAQEGVHQGQLTNPIPENFFTLNWRLKKVEIRQRPFGQCTALLCKQQQGWGNYVYEDRTTMVSGTLF